MKYDKRYFAIFIFLCYLSSLILLSACTFDSSSTRDDTSKFLAYHSKTMDGKYIFHTSNDTEIYVVNLEKEKSNSHPVVILNVIVGVSDDELKYQWMQKTPDERKTVLKECSERFIAYTKNADWKNDYYLYVVADETSESTFHTVYDYERNTVWIPNCEDVYMKMYEHFGTFSKNKISEADGGKTFLVTNDFAKIKHNELEFISGSDSYNVYINKDGIFKEYGKDKSTCY